MARVSHFSDLQSNPTSPKSPWPLPDPVQTLIFLTPEFCLGQCHLLDTESLVSGTGFFFFYTLVYFLQIFSCLESPFLFSAEFCLM